MAEEVNKMNEIIIDDGSQRISIKNKLGDEIGVFMFRPTDVAIIQRYNEIAQKIDEIVAPLEEIDINGDGTADGMDPHAAEVLEEAESRVFEAFDYLFDGNMSEAFFGKMHPFSPVGGVFFCESALAAVGSFISAQFEQETKKISKRMGKYISAKGRKK